MKSLALAAAAFMVVLMGSLEARAHTAEWRAAQGYQQFEELLRPVQFERIRAVAAPAAPRGAPMTTPAAASRHPRSSSWSVWRLVSCLEKAGVKVTAVSRSTRQALPGSPWSLATSLSRAEAAFLPGACDAQDLQVKRESFGGPNWHIYGIYKHGKRIGEIQNGRPLYFTLCRNVFFATPDRALNAAVRKILSGGR